MRDFNAYKEMTVSAPAVADDRYSTSKTATQTSLNSTIMVVQIDLIEENGRVTIKEMATTTRIEHHVVQKLVVSLGCQKVCTCWFPC
jgi:hypothetical protein